MISVASMCLAYTVSVRPRSQLIWLPCDELSVCPAAAPSPLDICLGKSNAQEYGQAGNLVASVIIFKAMACDLDKPAIPGCVIYTCVSCEKFRDLIYHVFGIVPGSLQCLVFSECHTCFSCEKTTTILRSL